MAEMRPVGRPTLYREEYGDVIIEWMDQGFSLSAAASRLDVSRGTVYDWLDAHPEFAAKVKIAQNKRQFFLENRLLKATEGPVVTSSIFALKNAAPADWLEKTHTELTGKDGGAIETKASLDITGLSDAVLEELLSKLGQK